MQANQHRNPRITHAIRRELSEWRLPTAELIRRFSLINSRALRPHQRDPGDQPLPIRGDHLAETLHRQVNICHHHIPWRTLGQAYPWRPFPVAAQAA